MSDQWQPCDNPGDYYTWHTPPTCQGQAVLVSYALSDQADDFIYRHIWDRSDNTHEYARRPIGDDEEFEPWNTEPE